MSNLLGFVDRFFYELEMFEDAERGHAYKAYIHQSVREFLANESKSTALAVFQAFFDTYRIKITGQTNPFIDLLDIMRNYEEQAAPLIDKQRDHYIHSVNVFLLGLSIYAQNSRYQKAFIDRNLNKTEYPDSYDTHNEEFFYRWGLASLFHDIGYPVEIIGKQLNKFMDFISGIDNENKAKVRLEFENFQGLNSIEEVIPKRDFIDNFYQRTYNCAYIDPMVPIDLLALKLHLSLGVDLDQIKQTLNEFEDFMETSGFIDHGLFSAIIVLKWYGYLIQTCNYNPDYFFYPVLDSASAILLHNFYRNVMLKPPYERGPLSAIDHPIAFLLILCDELQEWNRQGYGILDMGSVQPDEVSLEITDDELNITYITKSGNMPECFAPEKENLLNHLLVTHLIFSKGIIINCKTLNEQSKFVKLSTGAKTITARPSLENLEGLAIAIHELYNQKQLERMPDKPLAYPRFSDLPDSLKYSNLRQARGIWEKIRLIGWKIRPIDGGGQPIITLPEEIVEDLAQFEHKDWVRERTENGWVFGKDKNFDKKISPYLEKYEFLDETIKELDRDTIRNIPALLAKIGMALYEE